MSTHAKGGQPELIEFYPQGSLHDSAFPGTFPQGPYNAHPLLHPGLNRNVQDNEFGYVLGNEYQSENSFEEPRERKLVGMRVASTHGIASNPRKRKSSVDDDYDLPPQKKATIAQVQVQDPNGDYYDLSGQTSPYSPFVPTPTGSTGFAPYASHVASPRPSGHHYSTSTASQVSLAAPSPHTPAFSPSFTTVKSEQSPAPPLTPIPSQTSTASPVKSNPKLVRTSTMQTSPPSLTTHTIVGHTQNFNPYAMYPLKACLELKGDLNSMRDGWSTEECDARRRLVEFKRHQEGSTIHGEFKPVAPQDRQPTSICVSCIWWKEKSEYYVTSVDTIYLLESLVGVRFTVEEKNRIRRNLEGFRPMTVSKSKLDSEEFFKVIMGFPHPKPRNIEKDVKVFPWKILGPALKKIISKYSASYSSTASALLTPAPSAYSSAESSTEFHYPPSPHMVPTHVNAYATPIEVGYINGPTALRMPAHISTGSVHELQLQMPDYVPACDINGQYAYAMGPSVPGTMPMPPQPMTAPIARMPAAWEYANFVNNSPVTMAPHSAPPIAYPRGVIEAGDYVPAMTYQAN